MKQGIFLSLLVVFSAFCYVTEAGEQTGSLAIRAGKIWTVTGRTIKDGVIIIEDGKIEAVGEGVDIPAHMRILGLSDSHIVPGFIDTHCHIGLSLNIADEMNEAVSAIAADMQILDAFNPQADSVKEALGSGVTTVLLSPGDNNPIAGQTAIVKLNACQSKDWIVKRSAGVKFSLRDEALMSDREPTSRAGLVKLIRDELNAAKMHKAENFDPSRDVLQRVVDAKLPVFISVYHVDEIASAMAIIDEFKLNAILLGAGHGDEIREMIAELNLPVIFPPLLLLSKDKDLRRVSNLAHGGVKVAFETLAPRTTLSDLRTSAILAMKYGLDRETALRSLTINAAEILGIEHRAGSIAKGKDADLVILNGDPLQLTSSVEMVLINGRIVYQRDG